MWNFIPALADVALGVLSAGGQNKANTRNIQLAREQMAFQERMSSTAVQRSVKDYEAAGLNPALAYERSESSPGGASATVGDAFTTGINTAQAARRQRQDMTIAAQQWNEQQRLMRAQTGKTATEAENAKLEGDLLRQQFAFNAINQPVDLRLKQLTAMIQAAGLPEATNEAEFQRKLGIWAPLLSRASDFTRVLQGITPSLSGSPLQTPVKGAPIQLPTRLQRFKR